MNSVDISVILVTYNRDEALCQTLRCLVNQDPPAREIIVVDQSSHHDETTRHFLKDLMAAGSIRYIFQAEPNAQLARNRAIANAVSEVLLFIDDDVSAGPGLVGAHWQNYVESDISAVCGFFTEPGEKPVSQLPTECKDSVTGWIYLPHCLERRVESYLLPAGNGSVRRKVAIEIGGFDENYTYTHMDDTDFACRLKQLGVKSVHDPEARLIHLKEVRGGKRPGGINDYVIADSNRWYIWFYFFWMNFGWSGRREIVKRLRGCVFRKKNIVKPWYFVTAIGHVIVGGWHAFGVIRQGRRLAFQETDQGESHLPEHLVSRVKHVEEVSTTSR